MTDKTVSACQYEKAWIGKCKKEVIEGVYCKEHSEKKCRACKEQATHDCENEYRSLICGAPLCDKCVCPECYKYVTHSPTETVSDCPFCQADKNGVSSGWGMGQLGWDAMRKAHEAGHPTHSPTETVSECCGAETLFHDSLSMDKRHYTCTKCHQVCGNIAPTRPTTILTKEMIERAAKYSNEKQAELVEPTVEKWKESLILWITECQKAESTKPLANHINTLLTKSVQEAKAEESMNHPTTVSACCGAEVETKYSSMLDKKQYTCTKCWLINCKVIDRTKQCFCQSIYNGETNTVDNCTCGKCADAIKTPTETGMKTAKTKEEIFRWGYRLLIALAKRNLKDAQNSNGEWPGEQEWGDLVGSSQEIFLKQAREEAGVDDWYLENIRNGDVNVDDIWEENL